VRVVRVFPDVVGLGGVDDVGAVEEDTDLLGSRQDFVRAVGGEFEGQLLQLAG
jgi:hypothetical protein